MASTILRAHPTHVVQVLLASAKGVLLGMGEQPALEQVPLHAQVLADLSRVRHAVELLHARASMQQDLKQLMLQQLHIASMQPSCLRHVTVRVHGTQEWAGVTPRMF